MASQKYSKCPVSLLIKDFSKINLKAIFRCKEAFRVKNKITKKLKRRKQRIQYRLRDINWKEQNQPMFSAGNIHYDISDRTHGLAYGGIIQQSVTRRIAWWFCERTCQWKEVRRFFLMIYVISSISTAMLVVRAIRKPMEPLSYR